MKVSLYLANYYSDIDFMAMSRNELVERVGLQLGAVENTVDYSKKYKSIVIAKVVSCEKHPNADKLSVCRIDDGGVTENVERGDDGLVQVVCGAPNVQADIFVAWIPPGATVPSTLEKDPFVLESRELRGEMSNGMLASPKELDISEDHEGILIVRNEDAGREPHVGEPISDFFGLDDFIIDCENKMFTHRPDCFGNLGVARELAGISNQKFTSPDWYMNVVDMPTDMKLPYGGLPIDTSNMIPELVPRFMLQVVEGVAPGTSPIWLQSMLKRVGIRSVNTIVDFTNYYMHLTAQPTHAFDYDKLLSVAGVQAGDSLTVSPRLAREGEQLELLNGRTIDLSPDDVVIVCNDVPVALGGVMGGASTEVDEHTKNIVLECANFDMYAIRRTSMRHGIFSDAVTRFNKGQSPLQNDKILQKLTLDICDITGGKAGQMIDYAAFDSSADTLNHVVVGCDFINSRLGSEITPESMKELLENVEFEVVIQSDDSLRITVPFWRMDISIGEDIVEEIGRLYGYGRLPVNLPPRSSKPATVSQFARMTHQIRNDLRTAGANEVLSYSFVHGDLLTAVGLDPDKWAYHLRNAISPDLQYYRPSLLPSVLAKVNQNIKAQAGTENNRFALFEIGKAHVKDHMEIDEVNLPKQMRRLALVFVADDKAAKKHAGSAYYEAKKFLESITDSEIVFENLTTNSYPITAPYQLKRSAQVSIEGEVFGVIGELSAKVRTYFKLPKYCAGFEIDLDILNNHHSMRTYKKLNTYPVTQQDITIEVSNKHSWKHVEQLMHAELAVNAAESGYVYELSPLDIYKPDGADSIRYSFRLELAHHYKTLKTEEVNHLLDKLAGAMNENIAARRI